MTPTNVRHKALQAAIDAEDALYQQLLVAADSAKRVEVFTNLMLRAEAAREKSYALRRLRDAPIGMVQI